MNDPKPLPDSILKIAELFCGCATIENTWALVRLELERLGRAEYKADDDLAAHLVDHLGLSEHGTSVRGGWLTDPGCEALAWFQENGDDGVHEKGPWIDSEGTWWGVS